MFEDYMPNRRIGTLCPLAVIDNHAYEFYQLVPSRVMLVMVPLGLQQFTAQDVERVFEHIDERIDMLMERGIDIILQAGVPLPILIGSEALARLLDHIERKTGLPATSTVLSVVAAAKRLGLKKVAVANKWSDHMNQSLAGFFGRDGIEVVGSNTQSMVPSEFVSMKSSDSIQLAYDLGRGALERYPEAEGVYIGGGSWMTLPVIGQLERELGKPVVTNQVATVWHLLTLLDAWKPIRGNGRLLESN